MGHNINANTLALEMPGVIRKGWARRAFDILFSLFVLTLTSPVLMFAILLIVLESPGNPFFIQRRLGVGGRSFDLIKLRTMIPDAEKDSGPTLAEKDDPRMTMVGKFLRRVRVDELPQFINVLKGDMAVVGPRPERPEIFARIQVKVPDYWERLRIEPGITGLAQVRGGYHLEFKNKLRYDLIYIKNQCFLFDMKLMAATIWVVFAMKGSV